jgi:hypothetical protein
MFSKAFADGIFCYKSSAVIDAHKWYLCKKSLAIIYTVYISSENLVNKWFAQRHTLRDRRPSTAACLGNGANEL